MSFFIDKHNRRKSPVALAAFGAALLYLCVFGVLTALLAEPLYRAVRLKSPAATTALHGLIIAAAGTAVCCLLFFLKDKRVAPYGFAGLAVVLCMFYAASLMLSAQARGNMLPPLRHPHRTAARLRQPVLPRVPPRQRHPVTGQQGTFVSQVFMNHKSVLYITYSTLFLSFSESIRPTGRLPLAAEPAEP